MSQRHCCLSFPSSFGRESQQLWRKLIFLLTVPSIQPILHLLPTVTANFSLTHSVGTSLNSHVCSPAFPNSKTTERSGSNFLSIPRTWVKDLLWKKRCESGKRVKSVCMQGRAVIQTCLWPGSYLIPRKKPGLWLKPTDPGLPAPGSVSP